LSEARTFSSGFGNAKLRTYWNLLRQHRQDRGSAATYHSANLDARAAAERYTGRDLTELDVLEIGAGQRFPLSLLVHPAGARVVGIDMDEVTPRAGARQLVAVWRRNGPERALKTLVRRALFDRAFYRDLARVFGAPLRTDGLDLRVMDACALGFPDESFDCILSVSVFEHIYDVDAAAREMARVLRPGGVAYVDICLFPGISGGHHPDWFEPEAVRPRAVPPWNHLRQDLQAPDVYLNRLRRDDYLAAFRRHLEVLELTCRRQGEAHFTEEVGRELPGYSPDDLLTGSMLVVLGKGSRPGPPPA